ncbi:hypothetical protein M7I_5748 [Glarea lozoyensis 74030]|uniref:Uncharacterized protein n=1 Tax=Glarea lozoyensis (strain ATCC 74030 / MF5533) TaxID=1104152 RepID=H0ESQ5_GLAL7|nr:hypothetical protein M7I_5748 [Glarea lozoyensis 74030]
MIQWMKSNSIENEAPETPEGSPDVTQDPRESQFLEKDFYYYNVARQVLDMIVEHQLEKTGISDASGLGKGSSPFKRVQTPCLSESQLHEDLGENFDELNGYLLCKTPDEYMFWDAFNIGSVAKRSIGSGAATMISDRPELHHLLLLGSEILWQTMFSLLSQSYPRAMRPVNGVEPIDVIQAVDFQ